MDDQHTPEVEELNPLEVIETLEDDVRKLSNRLKRINRINPNYFAGGPGNKSFGRRFQQAFDLAQKEAVDGLLEMESHVVPE